MPAMIPDGVRAVFFDAVGTLLFPDPSAPVVYAEVARRQGLNISPEEVRARFLTAYREEEAADRLAGWVTSEEREVARWRRIVFETLPGVRDPEGCFRELFDHFSRPGAWRVNPDAAFVFDRLASRGIILGLASNYDSRLLSVLDGSPELAPLRGRVVISASVGFRKPAREFFREVVRLAGRAPAEVLFVGDDFENDYEGAADTGLNAVLLAPRAKEPKANRVVRDLRELLE